MTAVMQAIPLLVLAGIVVLILRPLIARRGWSLPRPRAKRARPRRTNLTVVSRSRMDDELKDLLKRR